MGVTDSFIEVMDASDFPDRGLVRIDDELIIYDRKEGNRLLLAQRPKDRGGRVGEAITRGRYGTFPENHFEGSLAIVHPIRYWDRYEEETDHPLLSPMQFDIPAPRGFFREVLWNEEIPSERLDLVGLRENR